MASGGKSLASWAESDQQGSVGAEASFAPAGGAFAPATRVSDDPTASDATGPRVALSPNGAAFEVWEASLGANNERIWAARYVPAPAASTEPADGVGPDRATIHGTINPNGVPTKYFFQYGISTSYGAETSQQAAGSDTSSHPVSADLHGLTPGTTYHFRAVASSNGGAAYGSDQTFTTSATSPASVTSTPTASSPLAPEAVTEGARVASPVAATLYGGVNPHGMRSRYHFEYGLSSSYGQSAPAPEGDASNGTSRVTVSVALSRLAPSSVYHYRLVATSSGGRAVGADRTFRTPPVCRDRRGPVSRFDPPTTVLTRQGVAAHGHTHDYGGCKRNFLDPRDRGGVSRVRISFSRQSRGLCAPLMPDGHFGAYRDCRIRTFFFTAVGRGAWKFARGVTLAPGLYRLFAEGVDRRGNHERYDPRKRNGSFVWVK
jgi:hypothetical protein